MESVDIESKHSYIGSFIQPPHKISIPFADLWPKKTTAVATDTPAPNSQGPYARCLSIPKCWLHMTESRRSSAQLAKSTLTLVSALKSLQEKIHRLELERSQAEDDLNCLSREAAQYKKTLQHESNDKDIAHQELMQERKDVSVQLNTAQSRCSLLEKQVDYMRKMVISAELEKKLVLEQQTQLQKEKDQNQAEICAKLDKLEILEKECWRLTGTQKDAEEKIKHLQAKLQEEQHHRKLIQDKAAQLQTGLEMNRILMTSLSPQKEAKKKSGKKKAVKDELGQMSFEHQELLKQIQETKNHEVREDLERELECLVKQMEIKGEQITKLKRHQGSVYKLKQKAQKLKRKAANVTSKPDDYKGTKEVTVPPRGSVCATCSVNKSTNSLQLLKSAQKIQSVLKKDDILWEP
ncbi:PREDICTED: centrosomal protein CEP57L1 [Gekko japonicus]|uniref:Centrosomal protein 57kDa-like protein 1 n=1 Tax=Gekko japonicus TaxID=146911 RepID=A0ABM1JUF9_GEKJA|nr:PREDICTED: centrosomal protein CEP57L1 [Gekko japonicus]